MSLNNYIYKFFAVLTLALVLPPSFVAADCSSSHMVQKNSLVIGERSVSAMYHLGIIPSEWVGRKSLWAKSESVNTSAHFLSCPNGFMGPKRKI